MTKSTNRSPGHLESGEPGSDTKEHIMKTTPLFTGPLPRAVIATLAATGLFALSACASEEDTQNNGTTTDTTTETALETTTATTAGGDTGADTGADTGSEPDLTAAVTTAEGAEVGTAEFREQDGAVSITVGFNDMEPGFYGLHIHQIGVCETDSAAPDNPDNTGDFLSAGSHLGAGESDHPDHPGDLPQLLVKNDGTAVMTVETDRFTLADLEDDDGSALMIHSDADNFANIPERYSPDGADEDTLGTGDAGSRLACGVIG
ncbi:copper/zinc superoxide dismutase [Corynebacterium efficiens YS-314]|nr:copper/zinc superoxide dismutase [Corynebacterium efficiens YS-314]